MAPEIGVHFFHPTSLGPDPARELRLAAAAGPLAVSHRG